MPVPDRYEKMVLMLLDATEQGRADWTERMRRSPMEEPLRTDRFWFKMNTASIEISKQSDEYSGVTIELKIFDENGELLDEFAVIRSDKHFSKAVLIYDLALFHARNMGSVIDSIQDELAD